MTPHDFRLITDPLPEAMLLVSANGQLRAVNDALQSQLGIAGRDLADHSLFDLCEEPRDEIARYLRVCSRSRKPMLGAMTLRSTRGEPIPFRAEGAVVIPRSEGSDAVLMLRLTPKKSAASEFVTLNQRVEELAREVQRRRLAEEAIRDQELRLRITLQSIGDAVIVTDPEGRVESLNPIAQQLTGWSQEDAAGVPLERVFHIVNEQTRRPVENPALRALEEGIIVGLANHTILISRDGTERPIDDSAAPIRSTGGEILGAVLVFRDVTERRRATEEMEFQAKLLDTVGQAVLVTKADGEIIYWNGFAESLYGWSREEIVGLNVRDTVVPAESHVAADAIMERLRSGESWSGEFVVRRKDGSRFPAYVTDSPLFDTQGKLRAIIGISYDISSRKKLEQTLRFLGDASVSLAAVDDFESTLQKLAGMAVPAFADWCSVDLVDADHTLKRVAVVHSDPGHVEKARLLMERYPPDADAQRGIPHVIRTGEPEMVAEMTDQLLATFARSPEHLELLRELSPRSYIAVPLKGRSQVLGALTFVFAESGRLYTPTDLEFALELARRAAVAIDNAQMYERLLEGDRRKDEFLATLAHELRNPLAPISNALQLLRLPGVEPESIQEAVEMMERQSQHLIRLVDDLLDVSRVMRGKIDLRKEPVDLANVVARGVETARPVIDERGHQLSITYVDQPLRLDADPVRLAQVVGNLLVNAAKYTEPGGQIKLSIERHDGQGVLRVNDSGIGISPEMLNQIFDLFVQADHTTTRSQGGLGIGLTLVKNLVEMHGGRVEVTSAGLGQGSEFIVRLPLANANAQGTRGPASGRANDSRLSGHRLMVVDDNRDSAMSLALLLRRLGNEVQVAHDGVSAIELARICRPHLIFLDIGMPGMDGYEVTRHLRSDGEFADTVIVALTGWGQEEDRRRTAAAGFNHHLVKPPERKQLEQLLIDLPDSQP